MPVKPFSQGKSRLAPDVAVHKSALARCFYLDTLHAVLSTAAVSRVIVVTGDADAAALASARQATVVPDDAAGLNQAVAQGFATARSLDADCAVAVVTADLPCLKTVEFSQVLSASHDHRRAFLADHTRCGTTVLTAGRGQDLRPAFEGRSRWCHLGQGTVELHLRGVPSARLDVDTVQDLRAAAALGVGPCTARLLEGISGWRPAQAVSRGGAGE
ncbi:2-phospho-L-lactate guanylyltransferase [Streptomyces caelestis]|uniref:2-phospho-L-lactate guanylyltransferase n=1 Tax=Streptomyces caelestis TaxID=36816 RepID=UPI0037008A26